ncbi:ATP-binding protein [Streptomyces sp. NPDC021218]|uniref:ATP-binding protein n=1 Tax=Streptomyces sp. NPDC021218 TaxID=3365119 RepID=UPI00379135FA
MTQVGDGGRVVIWRWSDRSCHVAPRIRVALRCTFRELRIPDKVIEDAVMAAWELTANSLEHARGPYEMRLLREGPSFVFEIEDSDPRLPVMQSSCTSRANSSAELTERGRGLQIVDAFTRGRWGFRPSGSEKKIAWMAISVTVDG